MRGGYSNALRGGGKGAYSGRGGKGKKGGGGGGGGARFKNKDEFVNLPDGGAVKSTSKKYKVLRKLGDGSFGRVFLAQQDGSDKVVALKIMLPFQQYLQYDCDARKEAEILCKVNEGYDGCMRIFESFDMTEPGSGRTFVCLVLEPLQCTLHDFWQRNDHQPFHLHTIQTVARQLLEQVAHLHSINFIHTDIKHKNIMFQSGDYYLLTDSSDFPPGSRGKEYRMIAHPVAKIIDYGSGVFPGDKHTHPIHTKQFRAPEVSLRCSDWDERSDLWTLGCVLAWMYTGTLLFNTHDTHHQLAMIEAALGPFPQAMVRAADPGTRKWFNTVMPDRQAALQGGRLLDTRPIPGAVPLKDLIPHPSFRDVVRSLLTIDPLARPAASAVLTMPFFHEDIPSVDVGGKAPVSWDF